MQTQDYYQRLGVSVDADPEQIKAAYRDLALRHHPDRNKDDPSSADRMKALNEAYAVLSDPAKRRQYDALRQRYGADAHRQFRQQYTQQDIFKDSDIQAIFEEISKAFGLRGFDDIFREFYGAGYRQFEFRRPGMFARGFFYSGGGRKPSRSGRQLGKLSRFLLEKISGVQLPKDGADSQETILLSPQQAEQGGPYAYLHRERDKKLVVKIPPGVRDGQRIRLAGMGQAGSGGGRPGDLYLKVHIRRPLIKKLKRKLTDLIDRRTP